MKDVAALVFIGFLAVWGDVHAQDRGPAMDDLLGRIEALEADRGPGEEGHAWTDRITWRGDFRYRHEYLRLDTDGVKNGDRHRNRLRARVGLIADLDDDLDVGFEISSGEVVDANGDDEGDPVSNNQILTNAWSLKKIWITQGYFDWHPGDVEGLHLMGGKVKRPFITPVKTELVWDSDVFPEGAVAEFNRKLGHLEVLAHGYGFWVIERGGTGDSGLFGAQAAVKHDLEIDEEEAHIMAGLSYYDYTHVKGEALFVDGDPFGNSVDATGTLYDRDYNLLEAFLEVGFRLVGLPVAVFGNYVNNTATGSLDNAWTVGVKLGKAKEPGTWDARWQYRETEADAVFGAFVDSDFGGGGTDSNGHEINVGFQLAKHWKLGASYFYNHVGISRNGSNDEFQRAQLDLKFGF